MNRSAMKIGKKVFLAKGSPQVLAKVKEEARVVPGVMAKVVGGLILMGEEEATATDKEEERTKATSNVFIVRSMDT